MIEPLTASANNVACRNPNSALLPTEWLPANNESRLYLEIGKDMSMQRGALSAHMDFWDSVYTVEQGGSKE